MDSTQKSHPGTLPAVVEERSEELRSMASTRNIFGSTRGSPTAAAATHPSATTGAGSAAGLPNDPTGSGSTMYHNRSFSSGDSLHSQQKPRSLSQMFRSLSTGPDDDIDDSLKLPSSFGSRASFRSLERPSQPVHRASTMGSMGSSLQRARSFQRSLSLDTEPKSSSGFTSKLRSHNFRNSLAKSSVVRRFTRNSSLENDIAEVRASVRNVYRGYSVGDSVLIGNSSTRWANLVNKYGYSQGGGITSEEQ